MKNKTTSSGKKNYGSRERRKSPRYVAAFHLHLVYDDLDELRGAYTRDISEGGVFVATDQPLPVSSTVQMKISLVHEELTYIEAEGEVIHVIRSGLRSSAGMGVKFVKISEESKQFIKEYVLNHIEETSVAKAKPKTIVPTSKKGKKKPRDKK